MSLKSITLCALLLVVGITATWAEGSKTLQPRPTSQIRDSKDMRLDEDLMYNSDDEDGNDIIDEIYEKYGNEEDLMKLDSASVALINKMLDEEEELEAYESRAANGNRRGSSGTRRNRNGSNRCGNRRLNRRGGNKRNNRNNRNNRKNSQNTRNGKRRRNGAKRVARA